MSGNKKIRSERVRDWLIQHILNGVLRPGMQLNEKELADWFDVSRTPVREANRHLAAMGLAEHVANKGAVVADLGAATAELDEALGELRAACVRRPGNGMLARLAVDVEGRLRGFRGLS